MCAKLRFMTWFCHKQLRERGSRSRQVPSIDFCYAGEGVEAVYKRKPLNR